MMNNATNCTRRKSDMLGFVIHFSTKLGADAVPILGNTFATTKFMIGSWSWGMWNARDKIPNMSFMCFKEEMKVAEKRCRRGEIKNKIKTIK